ncbi:MULTISPECIES: quinone-dependent dihydroorotate dehydrogenase [unclassified Aureimonas]|uniref:quinone-dependent dihydroorotate dehydrogenase n=1 Tax=unclassified Aureimonas TaxID=2615206 RepID=UPI0006FF516C|nr:MULTISPECIES: quinone-dependent dihydroorotate dehydrogenase [unclassified Aureimonas]KQT60671.1 dihydroorotate dehydrogenase (quinone) [Aureimonas sp. Leaf460]KQT68800.1 dihydroorotate dehydrogenase (quinone) [Aureimonas sp. Leaf427]
MIPFYRIARPILFQMDAENAHTLSIKALKRGMLPRVDVPTDHRLRVTVAGLQLPNPLGLAAGYDKNAEVPDAALRLGFGFAEVGTVTPLPQVGNERPRVFRLPESGAVINRLGFNNEGHAAALARLQARSRKPGIVGVNVGANKDSADRIKDYVDGVSLFEPVASYITINISSPNTPGLRKLQTGEDLDRLLHAVVGARNGFAAMSATAKKPIFLKVAPDLARDDIAEIARAAATHGIDGLIVSNTTLSRNGLPDAAQNRNEAGGLSGRPLFRRATWTLAAFRRALGPDMALIGAGGVENAETAMAKIEAGADLVQLYTGLVYGGPRLPVRILNGLREILDLEGVGSIADLRDRRTDEILAAGPE